MAIERLAKDARCAECGALLKKGTRVKVYRTQDGRVLVYGFDCHKRKPEPKSDAPNGVDLEPLLDALADARRALWTIVDLLKGKNGVATEQVLEEVEQEAEEQETPLEAADWRKFWVTVKRLGYDTDTLHELYQCESLKEVIKSKEDMERVLEELRKMAL